MIRQSFQCCFGILALGSVFGFETNGRTQPPAVQGQPPPSPDQQAGVEVLAHGPVHEAFAQPMNVQPVPGPVAPKQPPDLVEEISPDQKPAGANVQWISGYWSWDEDGSAYIWVSGFWRVPPPGRTWLAGHWQPIDRGWQWVAGLWMAPTQQQVQYLPPPPPTIDQGPSTPAPSNTSTYITGCWSYQQTRYLWRPGYWVAYQPDWVWNSAYYVWTPSGCLYNDGYWDHPLDGRGLLFAPVRFGGVWGQRPFCPQYVVNQDFLMGALFVRLAAQHYYFGDYFDNRYAARGFVAWPDYRAGRGGYDPNYNYYRRQYAGDPRWESGMHDLYLGRSNGQVPRPPRTLVQQVQTINIMNGNRNGNVAVAKNINVTNVQNVTALARLNEVHNTRVTNMRGPSPANATPLAARVMQLTPVGKDAHVQEQMAAAQLRNAGQRRSDVESRMLIQGGVPVRHTDAPKVVAFELPRPHAPIPAPVPGPKPAPAPVQKQAPPAVPKPAPLPVQKQAPPAAPPPSIERPRPPAPKPAPPPPVLPKHEERPIPKYEPIRPPAPPMPQKKPQ